MTASDPTPINQSMTALEWTLLITLSLVWGGSFFFNGVAVRELPTLTIVVARVAMAALALLVFMRLAGLRMPRDRTIWGAFLVMGLLNNALPFSLIVWGQGYLASGVAAVLNAATPLFTVMVANLMTEDEKLRPAKLVGVLVGFAGVAVMVGAEVGTVAGVGLLAPLACLAAALSYAFAGVFGRRFRRLGVGAVATATGQVCASSLLLLPAMLIVDRPWTLPMPSLGTWGALVGVALLSTAFAYFLYFKILETAGATNLLLVTLLVPVSAILLGIGFLEETLSWQQAGGMMLIAFGLSLIDGRLWRRRPIDGRPWRRRLIDGRPWRRRPIDGRPWRRRGP